MFETVESFQKKIYVLRQKTNQSLIETIIQFCDERRIEYESVAPFISGKLKSDIREEFEQLNFLPKTRKFPDIFGNTRGSKRKISSY
tara:strand:- start:94 stop:354 length:261 start_codon:yes stop_codon:yes gene_type:complete